MRLGRVAWAVPALAALLVLLVGAAPAPGGPTDDALPDIVSDPPAGAYLQLYSANGDLRLLLRFDGYVHNAGTGALEMTGSNNTNGVMGSVVQRIYTQDGLSSHTVPSPGSIRYETADGHNHFHLRDAMQYALFNSSKVALVAPSAKVGFCLADGERITGSVPSAYAVGNFCERNNPTAPSVTMGVSAGWRDVYVSTLSYQWIDVSDVLPGDYWLAARADPDSVIAESNEANNGWGFATVESVVPGYLAQGSAVAGTGPTTIPLSATKLGSPGPVEYKIVSAPTHGSLDQPVGVPFSATSVTYTPQTGYVGGDTFAYSALDQTSPFPLNPATAGVTITVNAPAPVPSVTISGAPASLTVGTAVQLAAAVHNDVPGITWSVDGRQGGSTTSGSITPSGLYTAPPAVPPNGQVVVSAASAKASAQVTIAIQPAPVPQPAPSPLPTPPTPAPAPQPPAAPPVNPPASTSVTPPVAPVSTLPPAAAPKVGLKLLSPLEPLAVAARGRLLLVSAVSTQAGTMTITAGRAGHRLGRCVVPAAAGRHVTCAIRLRPQVNFRGIEVNSTLRASGLVLGTQTVRVERVAAFTKKNGVRKLYCTLA